LLKIKEKEQEDSLGNREGFYLSLRKMFKGLR